MLNRILLIVVSLLAVSFSNLAIAMNSQNLDFIVLGVIASNEDQSGVALLKHKATGKVKAFKEGQKIDSKMLIKKIDRRSVAFSYKNKMYSLNVGDSSAVELTPSNPAALASDDSITNLNGKVGIERNGSVLTVSSSLKRQLVGENLTKVLMQAAAVPHTINGKLVGFMLKEIDSGSIYDVAGFQDGDIITHIDEKPINNVALALRALRDLKSSNVANFNYLRSNQERQLTIRIN